MNKMEENEKQLMVLMGIGIVISLGVMDVIGINRGMILLAGITGFCVILGIGTVRIMRCKEME